MYIFFSIILFFILVLLRPVLFIWDKKTVELHWWLSFSCNTSSPYALSFRFCGIPIQKKWLHSSNRWHTFFLFFLSGFTLLISFVITSCFIVFSFILKKFWKALYKLMCLFKPIINWQKKKAKLKQEFEKQAQSKDAEDKKEKETTENKQIKRFFNSPQLQTIRDLYQHELTQQLWKVAKKSKFYKVIKIDLLYMRYSSLNYTLQGTLSALFAVLSTNKTILLESGFEAPAITWQVNLKFYWFRFFSFALLLLLFFPYKNIKKLYTLLK